MTNAAFLLADLFDAWTVGPSAAPEAARGFTAGDIDDLQAWRGQSIAADHVRTIDNLLNGMAKAGDDVSMFEPTLPRWYAAVFWATTPWQVAANAERPVCKPYEIQILRALGALLAAGGKTDFSDTEAQTLSDVLEEARRLLEGDDSDMPTEVRRYLWSLIARAQTVLNDWETFGYEAVRQVALELGGALDGQAVRVAQDNSERAGRWRSVALKLILGFAGGAGSGAAGELGGEVLKQITGG